MGSCIQVAMSDGTNACVTEGTIDCATDYTNDHTAVSVKLLPG